MQTLVRIDLKPGAVGKWTIQVDKNASQNLFKDGDTLQWSEMADSNMHEYGNFDHFEKHHMHKVFGKEDADNRFRDNIKGWGTDTARTVSNGVASAFKDMGTQIIMPAGKVFTFAGMDTDENGHMYVQVAYANDGGFEVEKKKAKV